MSSNGVTMFVDGCRRFGGSVIAVAVVAGVLACSPGGTEPLVGGESSLAAPSAVTLGLGSEVSKQLASLRNATAAFHNVSAAIAAGYADPAGVPCVASPAGTMGIHVANPSLIDTNVVPNEPEVLLYLPKKNGGFKLVAVEYFVPVLLRNVSTGAISPWFSPNRWGAGYVVVNPAPSVFGQTFEGPMGPHDPGMPWHYDKHVWVWETNPSGMFSQWNPSISC